jgi:branched-chain amino acid transport system ATP-binding protein
LGENIGAGNDFMIEASKLSKSFGGVTAVSDISFTIQRGEAVGIIGPNGSGKTTLINLITGFVAKDSGKVFFGDKDITKWPAHRIADAGLTRTFQIVRPYTTLPAYKNLIPALFAPRSRRVGQGSLGDRDMTAIELLEEVGFERDAHVPYKPAGTLPLGYLKRLEIARCLALRPDVIICDEVFSGLSAAEMVSMISLLERIRMKGINLIMIEHRIKELLKVVDRLILMNFGAKLIDGPSNEVMNDKMLKKVYLGVGG